jgi:hypothetical protein
MVDDDANSEAASVLSLARSVPVDMNGTDLIPIFRPETIVMYWKTFQIDKRAAVDRVPLSRHKNVWTCNALLTVSQYSVQVIEQIWAKTQRIVTFKAYKERRSSLALS